MSDVPAVMNLGCRPRSITRLADQLMHVVAGQAVEEAHQIADFFLGEIERADARVLSGRTRAASVIMAHHLVEARERAVVHVRPSEGHIAQARGLVPVQILWP